MANSLLDFVMSVVRDPGVAARYAQNPAQAIADAHLTGVTSVDVDNLIPMVSESLTPNTAVFGADTSADDGNGWADGNIWASGAATAAFDAFADHQPGLDDFAHPAVPIDTSSGQVVHTNVEVPGFEPVFAEPVVDAVADPVGSALLDPVIDAVTPHVDAGFDGHPAPDHDFFA